ncbi:acetyl-CoA carboxylase biotin carboxylase subunit [Haloactinospora alba]|uniref:biotin carboxylase n=1 Tax=Haloactinospora alba TaxID=405555 RepID=A0A543N9E9_9ACTN|nr:acetyl-CoA carboxylase biotin carboxylase subunit [Haloactinospora alba]TQN28462.1 acetyl-CoA carboxylase biotin carboxylase subunit [Haloactinospora alba]
MGGMRRVLVANRGEIALRVVRACHAAGIEAVAVYSDADRDSRWVRLADDAVHIGASSVAKSYLNADALLEAARSSGADAVHPGYGFLSESAEFARRVSEAGLVFVGAPSPVIARMGDKAAARAAAEEARVPVIPGSGPLADENAALETAPDIGYPLLVKASAGGGGKGIRPVRGAGELPGVLATARAEARASFGDDTVYLERSLEGARHVEVQVLADDHGNVIHVFDRECSVQRRRQKLLEEAPSPGIGPKLRGEITAAATRLAAHVGYRGAGTVEFLVAPNGEFHFLEMNTRIQVEHPVTECVTGVDLVAEQLRVASGGPLALRQEDVALDGSAVELRINAEDPDNGFMPTPGELTRFDLPGGPGIRIDTGFVPGDRITPFYDSMIAKLVCWGTDREQALARAGQAVSELGVEGVASTRPLHEALLASPEVRKATFHTAWLEEWLSHRE